MIYKLVDLGKTIQQGVVGMRVKMGKFRHTRAVSGAFIVRVFTLLHNGEIGCKNFDESAMFGSISGLKVGTNATLAQLVEQRFCKAKVPGPNPGGGSITHLFIIL